MAAAYCQWQKAQTDVNNMGFEKERYQTHRLLTADTSLEMNCKEVTFSSLNKKFCRLLHHTLSHSLASSAQ